MNTNNSTISSKTYVPFKTAGVERARIDQSGNIGINTTAPSAVLDINGNTKMRGQLDISGNNIINIGSLGIGTATPAFALDISGASKFRNTLDLSTNNITNANQISATTNLVLQPTTGNVGIGTSAPAAVLDVNGDTKIRGALDLSTNNITNASQISATTNLVLQPTTGNVGIGTSAPAAVLDVNGDTKIRGALDLSTNNITNANQISATTNLVLQPTSGNVGIGTTAPSQIFQVGDGGRMRISNGITDYTLVGTKETDDASNTRIVMSGFQRTGNTGEITYVTTNNGAHTFITSGISERMRITSTGRVGIGTSTPTCNHHIYGSLNNSQVVSMIENASSGSSSYVQLVLKTDQTNTFSIFKNSTTRTGDGGVNTTTIRNDGGKLRLQNSAGDSEGITISGNCVGIGNNAPSFPLHVGVTGGRTITASNYPGVENYWKYPLSELDGRWSGGGTWQLSGSRIVSAKFEGGLTLATDAYIYGSSDIRIKNNIRTIDNKKSIELIRKLNPTTYHFIDYIKHSKNYTYGFIAQEVNELLPEAIYICKSVIPNFMIFVDVENNFNKNNEIKIITKTPITFYPYHDSSNNEYYTNKGEPLSDLSGNQRFKIILYDESNNEIVCHTTKIIDDYTIIIDSEYKDELKSKKYFLYGQEIDDFYNLNKDIIFTITTAALQEVDRQQQSDKARIAELEQEVATQKSTIATILDRLEKIETKSQ